MGLQAASFYLDPELDEFLEGCMQLFVSYIIFGEMGRTNYRYDFHLFFVILFYSVLL